MVAQKGIEVRVLASEAGNSSLALLHMTQNLTYAGSNNDFLACKRLARNVVDSFQTDEGHWR